jgi:hypothetical protein
MLPPGREAPCKAGAETGEEKACGSQAKEGCGLRLSLLAPRGGAA